MTKLLLQKNVKKKKKSTQKNVYIKNAINNFPYASFVMCNNGTSRINQVCSYIVIQQTKHSGESTVMAIATGKEIETILAARSLAWKAPYVAILKYSARFFSRQVRTKYIFIKN
ncbi:hypothetical protein PUN28_000947 [Cardiocondyla obscurior]|uniref:Uncharacterized protein n=1 Tax=Cardiocondyla obscurior TaxID=286306 RepID=A0AAW2H2B4_9HYME